MQLAELRNGSRDRMARKAGDSRDVNEVLREEVHSLHYMQYFKLLFVLAIAVVLALCRGNRSVRSRADE